MVTLPRIAIHEGGHIIAAEALGLGISYADLELREVQLDRRRNRRPGPYADDHVARFLVAGFCAERRFDPRATQRENSAPDFERAIALVGPDRVVRLVAEADALMVARWCQVSEVARALLGRGRLSADEIRDILIA